MSDERQPQQTWKVGTLVYSTTALYTLFVVLMCALFFTALRDRTLFPVAQIIFKRLGPSNKLFMFFVSILPSILNFFINPIISYSSDRHRGKYGRRIPYIIWSTPFAILFMLGMAFSTPLTKWLIGMLPVIAGYNPEMWIFALFMLLAGIALMGAGIGVTGLIRDVVPEQWLGRFQSLNRIVMLAAGIIVNYWLFRFVKEHYLFLFIGAAVVTAIGITILCTFIKEGGYPPPPELPAGENGAFGKMKVYLHECFDSKYYWMLFIMITATMMVATPINGFAALYADKLDLVELYGKCNSYGFLCSFILSFPLGMLADKFHPLRCGIVAVAISGIGAAVGGFLLMGPTWFDNFFITEKQAFPIAIFIHCVLTGSLFTVTASLAMRLYPRLRFAQFNSACGLVHVVIAIIVNWLLASFLDIAHNQYGYTFFFSAFYSFLTLIVAAFYLPQFKKHGGFNNYVAP